MSLADDLIRSGEYRIKIIHRLEPLWTMYIPQLRGLFGWKTIWYNQNLSPNVSSGYICWSYMKSLDIAKMAIEIHYKQNNVIHAFYEPTPKD